MADVAPSKKKRMYLYIISYIPLGFLSLAPNQRNHRRVESSTCCLSDSAHLGIWQLLQIACPVGWW